MLSAQIPFLRFESIRLAMNDIRIDSQATFLIDREFQMFCGSKLSLIRSSR